MTNKIFIIFVFVILQGQTKGNIDPISSDSDIPVFKINLLKSQTKADTIFNAYNVHNTGGGTSYYQHFADSFDNRTFIGRGATRPIALAWNQDNTILYGINFPSRDLVKINPNTGVATHIANFSGIPSNEAVQGIAIDENDICYISSQDRSATTYSKLYQCNLSTGFLTPIGSQTNAPGIEDIAATCNHLLYGYDSFTQSIYSISIDDGSATLIGNVDQPNIEGLNSITYDRESNILYHYIHRSNISTALAAINTQNAEITYLSNFNNGQYTGVVKTSCSNQPTFKINAGINGSWFNPQTSGQGFLIEVLPTSNTLFIAWFTYNTTFPDDSTSEIGSLGQRWLTAQGELLQNQDNNSIELTIYNTHDGIFNDPNPVTSDAVGTMTVTFNDCEQGTIDFEFNDGNINGTIPIQRIANDNVSLCEELSIADK